MRTAAGYDKKEDMKEERKNNPNTCDQIYPDLTYIETHKKLTKIAREACQKCARPYIPFFA